MKKKSYTRAQDIYEAGSEGKEAFIIVDGAVQILHRDEQGIVLLAELGPGEIFGEMALLENSTRSVSARAKVDTTVYAVSHHQFGQLMGELTPDARHVLSAIMQRLRTMNERLIALERGDGTSA